MRNFNFRFMETAQTSVSEIMRLLEVWDYAWTGSNAMFLHDVPLCRKLHDIDLLVPASYKARIIEKLRETKLLKVTKQSYGYKGKDIISIKGVKTPEIDLCFIPNERFRKETDIIQYYPLGNFRVASVKALIDIKLDWFRPKDKLDLKLIGIAQRLNKIPTGLVEEDVKLANKVDITEKQMSAIGTYALAGCSFYDLFSVDVDWGNMTFNQFIKGVEAYTAMYNDFCDMHTSDLC